MDTVSVPHGFQMSVCIDSLESRAVPGAGVFVCIVKILKEVPGLPAQKTSVS